MASRGSGGPRDGAVQGRLVGEEEVTHQLLGGALNLFAGGWREAVAAAASAPEQARPVRLTVSVALPEITADQRHDGVALEWLGLCPLVCLDLRLGEGTGALLALPLVQAAARALAEVATFDAAGVTEKQ